MFISPEEYLSLTDQLSLLSLKSKTYEAENVKLNQTIVRQAETIKILNQRIIEEANKNRNMELEIIQCINKNSEEVNKRVQEATIEQMNYFQQELAKIKSDANANKIKELEKKMAENRFINHEMVDFYQKIQNLYLVLTNTKTPPSMPELYKWATIRKAEETNLNSTFLNAVIGLTGLGGTQKSMMTTSKMNTSKMNTSKMNTSKINISKTNIKPASNMNVSKMNKSNFRPSSAKPISPENALASLFLGNKQNVNVENKNKGKKLNKVKKNKQTFEASSETEVINVDEIASMPPTDQLIDNSNSSIVEPVNSQ